MKLWLSIAALAVGAAGSAGAVPLSANAYSPAFHTCMDDPAAGTLQMRMCIGEEHDRADAALNSTYRVLMGRLPAARRHALLLEERAWINRTQHLCEHAGDGEAGGTLQPVNIASCYLDETIRREQRLRTWR